MTKIDISPFFGLFCPAVLVHFCHLQRLDISGCRYIDPSSFVDCVQACKDMKEITLVSCYHFSECHLVRILTNLPKLEIVDCTRATPLMFCDAYTILCSLKFIRIINIEPKHEVVEVKDWKKLVAIFHHVHFGHSVKRILPHYGNNIIVSNSDEEWT